MQNCTLFPKVRMACAIAVIFGLKVALPIHFSKMLKSKLRSSKTFADINILWRYVHSFCVFATISLNTMPSKITWSYIWSFRKRFSKYFICRCCSTYKGVQLISIEKIEKDEFGFSFDVEICCKIILPGFDKWPVSPLPPIINAPHFYKMG